MVAYSFKKRFVPKIESGEKCQTIRGDRARHARVGEPIQLYYGMRTKHCRKIIPDPVCTFVGKITLDFLASQVRILGTVVGETMQFKRLFGNALDPFAQADGFKNFDNMRGWWLETHGHATFHGFLIQWRGSLQVPAESRPQGADHG